MNRLRACATVAGLAVAAVTCASPPQAPQAGPGDAPFQALASEVLQDHFTRHPTAATDLGIHSGDDRLDDYSARAVADEARALKEFRRRIADLDPARLSLARQLDRDQILGALDAALLQAEVIKPWARDPDVYSSSLTRAAYVLIKRRFAAPEERLRRLVSRLNAMPAVLDEARRNLDRPPRVFTDIALDQMDGNREFFRTAVLDAFPDVSDPALHASLRAAVDRVTTAFDAYKAWMTSELLPRSTGEFAYGAETYRARLRAEERIDVPLDRLLAIAEADLRKNQAAFAETARAIDPARTPAEVLAEVMRDHPSADKLLSATQAELDALATFIVDHRIATIPQAAKATVVETPPFMRATTTASMDVPGPFETVATEAYYSMTLPDPAWSAADREAFMGQWYYPSITNVSVHEVWPGHYLQFLHARRLSSDVRKVFGTASNVEGWAHYVEQMMIDEGFHADNPRYRLAQIQDALLRDVRAIVGIRMHTEGMTLAEAEARFVRDAYQPRPVARAEARRGTSDATYGYYTLGKLMILKLRADYREKLGSAYTLGAFHDAFLAEGPLALGLVRRAMLGNGAGELF